MLGETLNRLLTRACATLGAGALVAAAAGVAHADTVNQEVGASGTTSLTLVGGSASTDITYWIDATSAGGNTGCDAADATPAVLTVTAVPQTGTPAGKLTIDNPSTSGVDNQLTFTDCGTAASGQRRDLRFTATAAGTWDVSATIADAGPSQYNVNPARFTLTVAAPTNTAPAVAVTGVTHGADYEYGQQPQPGCQVTDAEDGAKTVQPTLSAFTGGPAGSEGQGTQTATCTYTDAGGLTSSASATYTVRDTTAPSLTMPADQVVEQTSSQGAVATWAALSASDLGGLDGAPSCTPASGSTFPYGVTTVTCSVADLAGNVTSGTFTVDVVDTTAPTLSGGEGADVEATGSLTSVEYTEPAAEDIRDGAITPVCVPPSGSDFPVGETTVTCTATDANGNASSVDLSVVVRDTTGPAIDVPDLDATEATGPGGAEVEFDVSATDLVDGPTEVTCDHDSGATFGLGDTLVTCTSTDSRGNGSTSSFTVSVVDTTAPELHLPSDVTREATGPNGATVTYAATATDLVDTDVAASCIPASGSPFAVGDTTVHCTAVDDSGNEVTGSFEVHVVDTTPPALTLPNGIVKTATSAAGAPASFTATAADLVDGSVPVTCVPASGTVFAPGVTTVRCDATDAHGNTASGTFTVTVSFAWNGFFAPVDNGGVVNGIKGGQSVPLKWSIPNGSGGFVSDLSVVTSVKQATITCASNAVTDDIEAPTSGSTSLRYDTTANQFIYNWQSPKGAGSCYKLTVALSDGSTHTALFKTK